MKNPWKDLRRLPTSLWVLSIAILINRMGTMALPMLVLYLTKSLHFTADFAAKILFIFGAGSLIAGPLAGKLTDRFGAREVSLYSLLASGVLLLCYPFIHNKLGLALVTLLWSICSEAFRPSAITWSTSITERSLQKPAVALIRLTTNVGMGIGPALGGFLAMMSWDAIFWVDGVTSFAGAVLLAAFAPPSRRTKANSTPVLQFQSPFSDNQGLFLVVTLVMSLVFFQMDSTLPLFVVEHMNWKESSYGLLFTLNTTLIVLFEIPLNSATAHWPDRTSIFWGVLLTGIGYGLLGVSETTTVIILSTIIWTFGEIIAVPAMTVFVANHSTPGTEGERMGWFSTAFCLGRMLGAPAGIFLAERSGYPALWAICFVIGLVATGLSWRLPISAPNSESLP